MKIFSVKKKYFWPLDGVQIRFYEFLQNGGIYKKGIFSIKKNAVNW